MNPRARRTYANAAHMEAQELDALPVGEVVEVTLLDGQRALYRRVSELRPGRDTFAPVHNARVSSRSLVLMGEFTHAVAAALD